MIASVHHLHPKPLPIAAFLRVGHTRHRRLENLQAGGQLHFGRFVFDAAHIAQQVDLVRSLQASTAEIVLDPNFAELCIPARFQTSVSALPWAKPDRAWEPADFGRERNFSIAKAIAEFAVKHRVHAVLAPTNLIEDANSAWRLVNMRVCEALRAELDALGGQDIAIDYQLITSGALLRDEPSRNAITQDLADLPIENIWLRTSGFGARATGAGTRQFIESVRHLHAMNRPIIGDNVGGFAGLAAAAFGAIGGLCHGVAQRETFRASDWRKSPGGRMGSSVWVYVPELDRYFKEDQLDRLFAAKGAKARFGCNDTSCCPHGTEDMVENADRHFLNQRSRQIEIVSNAPESRRAEHFLLNLMDPALNSARMGARLKIYDPPLANAVVGARRRVFRLRDALGDLLRSGGSVTRSRLPGHRNQSRSAASVVS